MTKIEHEPSYRLGQMMHSCDHARARIVALCSSQVELTRFALTSIADDLQFALDHENAVAEDARNASKTEEGQPS